MIALMMFLFLSGGAKKAAPNPPSPNDLKFVPYHYLPSGEVSESITVRDGSTMVKLPDSEYSHLQDLRKAVEDEEKRLAVKYGAQEGVPNCGFNPAVAVACDAVPHPGDHYEFHGQFLLIEKANGEKK
jgi:hypothetical protein